MNSFVLVELQLYTSVCVCVCVHALRTKSLPERCGSTIRDRKEGRGRYTDDTLITTGKGKGMHLLPIMRITVPICPELSVTDERSWLWLLWHYKYFIVI